MFCGQCGLQIKMLRIAIAPHIIGHIRDGQFHTGRWPKNAFIGTDTGQKGTFKLAFLSLWPDKGDRTWQRVDKLCEGRCLHRQ